MFALLIPLFIIGGATGSVIIFLVFIPVMLIFLLFAMALRYIVPISIVVENLGAIEGIKRGIGFIRSDRRDVLFVSLLYLGASIAIELAVAIIIHRSSVKEIKRHNPDFLITIYALQERGLNLRKDCCIHFDPARLGGLATQNATTSRFFP